MESCFSQTLTWLKPGIDCVALLLLHVVKINNNKKYCMNNNKFSVAYITMKKSNPFLHEADSFFNKWNNWTDMIET